MMQPPLPISVAVVTLNEEENLPRCLESVRGLARQIVVLDCGSTDATKEAALEFGAEFHFAPWTGYVSQKNKCLALCTQPWALCLDADEALSPELGQSIRALFASGEPPLDGYQLNRRTFYLGAWICHSWYPEWRLRLVRKGGAAWTGLDPHDYLEVSGPSGQLQGDLLHYSFRDLHDHLQRTLKYGRLMAQSYHERGRRFHWGQLLISPWLSFFKHLLVKSGWRDGWRGWLIAFSKWLDVFAKYAFLLEIERTSSSKKSISPRD